MQTNGEIDNSGLQWKWPGYGRSLLHNEAIGFDVDAVASTCYLMTKQLWERVGGFDEELVTSHEDIDMGIDLWRKLQKFPVCKPNAIATHLGNATLRHQSSHNRAAFHHDRLYVVRKHYQGLDLMARIIAIQIIDFVVGLFVRAPKK